MSLIYIKGTPGSGKTAVCQLLQQRGYDAHDADDDDMGGPYNNETNSRVDYPEWPPPDEWFKNHSYRLIPEAIIKLRDESKGRHVFLCGTASNEDDLWHLFDQIFFLSIDENTLKKRIATRKGNDYGKTDHELKLIMEKYHADLEKRDRKEVITIDATMSLEEVVDEIVRQSAH